MISWIKGELISSWSCNQKFYILINCNGLGYEIQTYNLIESELQKELITLWVEHIKREDSDNFFGFINKEERDFFRDLLKVKGIGPQIGMSLLKNYKLDDIKKSLYLDDKNLISSVPGIGPKMTERIFFELKNKLGGKKYSSKNHNVISSQNDKNLKIILNDIDLTLNSLEYPKNDIKKTVVKLLNEINNEGLTNQEKNEKFTFEFLLKNALNYLESK